MQIFKQFSDIPKDKNTVLTVGTFDGVHIGHQDIFKKIKETADRDGLRSLIVTFDPHPRSVVSKDYNLKLLTTFDEKVKVLSNFDIDGLLVIHFTEDFAKNSSEKFIEEYLVNRVGLSEFVIGHDHKFGKGRGGDESLLRELGPEFDFGVTAVPPVMLNDYTISSTLIRNALLDGDLELANKGLGRFYSFTGFIVQGATRGRILGFPTANIEIASKNKLIPANGVYAVECSLDNKKIYGVMNIGTRPTFENNGDLVIEVHLFNFDENVYDKEIEVRLVERLRNEKKFESKEELIYQIERDKKKAIQILGKLIN